MHADDQHSSLQSATQIEAAEASVSTAPNAGSSQPSNEDEATPGDAQFPHKLRPIAGAPPGAPVPDLPFDLEARSAPRRPDAPSKHDSTAQTLDISLFGSPGTEKPSAAVGTVEGTRHPSLHIFTGRPGPHVAGVSRTLAEITESAAARNRRIEELESRKRSVAKTILLEMLDLSEEISAAVTEFHQSVTAFARAAGIEVRRAQRVYKLADAAAEIRQEILRCEAECGEDFEVPSWKRLVPTNRSPNASAEIVARLRAAADQTGSGGGSGRASGTEVGETERASERDSLKAEIATQALRIAELEKRLKRARYGVYGRGDQEKETPMWLFDHFDQQFRFTCDAAASAMNCKHPNFFDKERDGLARDWQGTVWLNPPYNDIERWLQKAWQSAQAGCTVVALVPLWAKMNWFQTIAIHAQIRLLSRRVPFVGHKGEPPFDLVVLVFTSESQCRDGRLHVTIEHVQPPARRESKTKRLS